ncbi:RodZ family helix-turn-helix domain-containing protein [Adlercreutzia sp. ZJ138]|uniref:helix-turn-helix domain-containing protein n=1 Tax=Adlercreutzia sp. ZJ138 TaxID=2709405 RepID=UPI0013EC36D0|nr:helix-turn-helix transcriptional regulator [Adlercreutzia sp. ZJ138]
MAYNDFGQLLREARERKGYDLPTAARRLRIRPDVIRAIENSDYEKMPPRGYARNMVNAYARLVGLNPTEVTRMYLDGAYDHRNGRQMGQGPTHGGFDMPGASRTQRMSGRTARDRSDQGMRDSRRMRDDAGMTSRRDMRAGGMRADPFDDRASSRSRRTGAAPRDGRGARSQSQGAALPAWGGFGRDNMRASRGSSVRRSGGPMYANVYSAPATSPLQGRLPFIVAGVIILVLLVIVVSLLTGNGKQKEEDVPSVPVTGLTDTTVDDNADANTNTAPEPVKETAPTKATLVCKVADGMEAYIEVYVDGETAPSTVEMLTGPAEKSFDVTGTLQFVTAAPSAVTLELDGEKVELTEATAGTGIYSYTVDFADILKKWNEEHPGSASTSGASTSSGSSDTSSANGSGTQAAGGTSSQASGNTSTQATSNIGTQTAGNTSSAE